MSLAFSLSEPASITARVIDRDGVPVRTLADRKALSAGDHRLQWDGRDDGGGIVPNEAL
jgi:flagellar hook assembly protein FlgD